MPHQQVRRLAAARPKPSGIASVWEISYRRALRAGSKQEILRAEWIAPGGFSGIQIGTLFNRLLGIRTFLKAATQRMGAHGVP
jgi:hypothetical protein